MTYYKSREDLFPERIKDKTEDKKKFSLEETKEFYSTLLDQAKQELASLDKPIMICGQLFNGLGLEHHMSRMKSYQKIFSKKGHDIFNQLKYLDSHLPSAPFNYNLKFEIFYKGIIQSGYITKCYFMPGWEKSQGARTEMEFCKENDIKVEIIDHDIVDETENSYTN